MLFGAGDTAEQIAQKIATAINKARTDFPPFSGSASYKNSTVFFDHLSLRASEHPQADSPLTLVGDGPGGKITGLAFMPDSAGVQHLYAVSDGGGFYEIVNYDKPAFVATPKLSDPPADPPALREIKPIGNQNAGAHLRYIGTIASDQNPGQNVEFAGLTLGPEQVENGSFADMFFGVSRTGDIYAMQLGDGGNSVSKQGVFVDGQTSVTVPGMNDVSGLAFSTLDFNMWHVTNRRAEDDGHDVNATYDLSRAEPPPAERDDLPDGGWSFYFGDETDKASDLYKDTPYLGDTGTPDGTYDAPGGAYGSLVTQPFSLQDYSKSDAPTLYFDYFLETGGPIAYCDTARVFASADGVNWYLLGATLDNPEANLLDTNGQWHQTRIAPPDDPWQSDTDQDVYYYSLADFCGLSEVRLRFDFSTSGEMHVGDYGNRLDTTGAFLGALDGNQLEDGDSLNVDGYLFEFDMGMALRLPNVAGDAIPDGETFTVTYGAGQTKTFEFDNDGSWDSGNTVISIESGQTTSQVGMAVVSAVNGALQSAGIVADLYGNRVMLNGAEMVLQSANATIELYGNGFGTHAGTPITITSMMSADEIAAIIGHSFDEVFAGGNQSFEVQGSVVRMIHHPVYDPGPLPYSNYLPGDLPDPLPKDWVDLFNRFDRGQDNAHEGFYIDNVTIGFAERGEMATQAPAGDTTFTFTNPDKIITTGYYQLQIRRASEYATWAPEYLYPMTLDRSFDINDRFDDSYTLTVSPANDISEGSTFTISDGVTPVTFQFLDENVPSGDPNFEPIYFSMNMSASDVAHLVVNAINSAAAAGLFNVTATMNEYSNLVDLFGAAEVTTPQTSPSDFNITLQFDGGLTASQQAIFEEAAYIWESIIIGDIPDVQTTLGLVDDIVINASGVYIDGQGGILGQAGPTGLRNISYLPYSAQMQFDTADLAQMEADGQLLEVITHEMGHSLGYGTIWSDLGLLIGKGTSDPEFIGAGAIAEYNAIFGLNASSVPVENTGGPGTADAHWRESVFYNELMTGWINPGVNNPLSRITAASMGDLGYQVNLDAAQDYLPPSSTTSDKLLDGSVQGVHLMEVLDLPRTYADALDSAMGTQAASASYAPSAIRAIKYTEQGDQNHVSDQGQILIQNSTITHSSQIGISVSATADSVEGVVTPQPGPTAPLALVNNEHQVPGVVIENNIVAYSASIGIQIDGGVTAPGQSIGSSPFARIINNTIWGTGDAANLGVKVINNASPTLLNNVVANTGTGIFVDRTSFATVVGTTAYSRNQTNLADDDPIRVFTETFPIQIADGAPLFVDAAVGNFYPAAGSRIIDSSLDSLQDRANMVTVKNPLGIPQSPILVPTADLLGQLRMDDPSVSPPTGFGNDTYKDRGAIDRVDFDGPTAFLVAPVDNDSAGIDRNPAEFEVTVAVVGDQSYRDFIIHLQDEGARIADYTVTPDTVRVTRDGLDLIEGRDYYFTYQRNEDQIILRSAGAAWAPEAPTSSTLATASAIWPTIRSVRTTPTTRPASSSS